MWRYRRAIGQSGRVRALPALARDFGAVALVLGVFAAAEALPLITVPAAALVLLPVLLLAAVVFGRDSAVLAALLAALATRVFPPGDVESASSSALLSIAALSAVALAVAALLEELHRSRAEAESAYLHSDATARRAAERVEEARRQLREAEERLAEAGRLARQAGQEQRAAAGALAPRKGHRDPVLDGAFRSEGGI